MNALSRGMPMAIRQDANAAGWAATWLLPHHRRELIVGSGLTDATLATTGVYSVTSPWVASMLGFGHLCQRLPAIAFPLLLPDRVGAPDRDVVVLKPDLPRRDDRLRLVKYEFRRGTANRLYVPDMALAVLADASIPLTITEGQKKALKASQEGIPTVALPGVWNFRTRTHSRGPLGTSRLLPDLDLVAWLGRQVELAYDADLATNPSVAAAAYALARELTRRGAHVRRVVLPLGPAGKLDDFLVRHGAAAYLALPRVDVTPPPQVGTSRRPVRVV